jgi:hypothetical protein
MLVIARSRRAAVDAKSVGEGKRVRGTTPARGKKPLRKPLPLLANRKCVYLQRHIRDEVAGAPNVSARLGEIPMRFAVLRAAACSALPLDLWRALLIALQFEAAPHEVDAGARGLVVRRLSQWSEQLEDRTEVSMAGLIDPVERWTEALAVAVIDYCWRFWRLSAELPVRQRLKLIGVKVVDGPTDRGEAR